MSAPRELNAEPHTEPHAELQGGLGCLGGGLALTLTLTLTLPLLALLLSVSVEGVWAGLNHRLFAPALTLTLRTSAVSLALTLLLGVPLAWWLASAQGRLARAVSVAVTLPIVLPPAVLGVALLQAFGRRGLLGEPLEALGLSLPFSEGAVVLAQLSVAAPLFVRAATAAFQSINPELMLTARALGASPREALLRVALPVAKPGLIAAASLAWARALGELGATLLFAGNMSGRTQTMSLAIFSALELDLSLALALSLVLMLIALLALSLTRWAERKGASS